MSLAFLPGAPLSVRFRSPTCRYTCPTRRVVRASAQPLEPELPTDTPIDTVEAYTRSQSAAELKAELFTQLCSLNRGFLASSSDREAVHAILDGLEKSNPTETPLENLDLLVGGWRLIYTNAPDILSLALVTPLAQIGQVYQNIEAKDADNFAIENVVDLEPIFAPLLNSFVGSSTARITVAAKGTRSSVSRINISFISAALKPVSFFGLEVPPNIPALKVPIGSPVGFIETTYLDEDIRIARAPIVKNQNTRFVLCREQ